MIVFCFDASKGGLSAAEFAAKNYLTTLVSILERDEPHALKLVKYDLQPWTVSLVVGCCLATKSLNLNNTKWNGGDNGCGSELLGVHPTNYLHSPDRSALVVWDHAALSGECNYCFIVKRCITRFI